MAIYDERTHMEPSAQSLLFPDIDTHLEQPPWDNYQRPGINHKFAQRESQGNSKFQIYSHVFFSKVRHLQVPSCTWLQQVGRASLGVVSSRVGRVPSIMGTAAARKIDV
jgi:hypothetical protein